MHYKKKGCYYVPLAMLTPKKTVDGAVFLGVSNNVGTKLISFEGTRTFYAKKRQIIIGFQHKRGALIIYTKAPLP